MERRVTSHTEEEEMNQRRDLLALARKGDQKAVVKLMELYQVKVYSGDTLKTMKSKKLPSRPVSPTKQKESLPTAKKAERKPLPAVAQKPDPVSPRSIKSPKASLAKTSPVSMPKPKTVQPIPKKVVETKAQAKPKAKATEKAKVNKKVVKKVTAKSKPKVKVQPKAAAKAKNTLKAKVKAKVKPQVKAKAKSASIPRVKVKSQPKTKSKIKPKRR